MLPAVYTILRDDSAVLSAVGKRIYRHGSAPQDVTKPYITWFVVTGMPEVQLSGPPLNDMDTIQIDCWSEKDAEVETLAYAVRKALDDAKIVNRIVQNNRENETRLYRIGIEADFIHSSR
jgi:phage anti-repressor protein